MSSLHVQLLEVTVILIGCGIVGCWAGNEICTRYLAPLIKYLSDDDCDCH